MFFFLLRKKRNKILKIGQKNNTKQAPRSPSGFGICPHLVLISDDCLPHVYICFYRPACVKKKAMKKKQPKTTQMPISEH